VLNTLRGDADLSWCTGPDIPVTQPTRWLLIGLLLLTSAGCARRDWVGDLLVLTDVTGTWEGTVKRLVPAKELAASKLPS